MVNHKKFNESTEINVYWSKNDTLYLDMVRGKMARGEFLSHAMHLSTKDKTMLKELVSQNTQLKVENELLKKELQRAIKGNIINEEECGAEALESIRLAFLEKNKEQMVQKWDSLNWKRIAANPSLKFKSVPEAKRWFESHISLVNNKISNEIPSITKLHPSSVVFGKQKRVMEKEKGISL